MTESFDASFVRTALNGIDPFNLRLTRRPLRCVTGLSIPPGLVGFCWETPLCFEVLRQQAPELARVVECWNQDPEAAGAAERRFDPRGGAHAMLE